VTSLVELLFFTALRRLVRHRPQPAVHRAGDPDVAVRRRSSSQGALVSLNIVVDRSFWPFHVDRPCWLQWGPLVSGNLNEAIRPVGCCICSWRLGCFVPQRECPDADETAPTHVPTDRHDPTRIRNRRPVDQFDCRSLDGISAQIMALVRSTLLWLGFSSCMAAEVRRAAVRRSQRTSSSFSISLPSRSIRGPHAFYR